jgi:hypothetical protein
MRGRCNGLIIMCIGVSGVESFGSATRELVGWSVG